MIRMTETAIFGLFAAGAAVPPSTSIENMTAVGVLAFIAWQLVQHLTGRRPEDKIVAKLDELIKAHVKTETVLDDMHGDTSDLKKAVAHLAGKQAALVALLTRQVRIDDTPSP